MVTVQDGSVHHFDCVTLIFIDVSCFYQASCHGQYIYTSDSEAKFLSLATKNSPVMFLLQ